jgi:hypothetical protein
MVNQDTPGVNSRGGYQTHLLYTCIVDCEFFGHKVVPICITTAFWAYLFIRNKLGALFLFLWQKNGGCYDQRG